jgi:hypothetical protein
MTQLYNPAATPTQAQDSRGPLQHKSYLKGSAPRYSTNQAYVKGPSARKAPSCTTIHSATGFRQQCGTVHSTAEVTADGGSSSNN